MSAQQDFATMAALLVLIVTMLVLVIMAWWDTHKAHVRADELALRLAALQSQMDICVCERNHARTALEDIAAGCSPEIDPVEALAVVSARAQRALVFVSPVQL